MDIICRNCKHPQRVDAAAEATIEYSVVPHIFRICPTQPVECEVCAHPLSEPSEADELKLIVDEALLRVERLEPIQSSAEESSGRSTESRAKWLSLFGLLAVALLGADGAQRRFQQIDWSPKRPSQLFTVQQSALLGFRPTSAEQIIDQGSDAVETEPEATALAISPGWKQFIESAHAEHPAPERLVPRHAYISSGFGYRIDPFQRTWKFHRGLDIAMRANSPIRAILPGRVLFSGRHRHYGKVVMVEHPHNLITIYGHASKLLVEKGDRVDRNTLLARVGQSGRSTGPHLHFEARVNGRVVDPMMIPELDFF